MKIKISILMTVAALLLLTGCPKKEDNNPEPGVLQLSLFTNPTDGALFQVQYEDGTTITCFGTKDAEGLPVAIQTAAVTFPDGQGLYQVKLENGVKPVQVLTGNGCVFEYDWLSTSSFRLKAISPTGEVQVSIPVDLGTMGETPEQLAVDPVNIRQGIASVAGIRDIQESPSSLKEVTGNMTFNIIQCGQKVNNAFVTIQTTPQLGQPNQAVTFSGDGAYSANLPQSGAPPPDYEKECEKLGTIVHDVCDYYFYVELFGLEGNMSTICNLLSTKIQ
ncbi:MAG: hypothetical protein D4R67_01525 [Bacteroidetes bacterium]|nr:MAG: hypothetical protein D4R67_01525 [Bacteroidota bacterium]